MEHATAKINLQDVDHTELIGRELNLKTEQFPGKILESRVVGISGNYLLIDRSGSSGLVDQLINNQPVEILITYKGEPISFQSKTVIPHKGRLQIPLAAELFPEVKREFQRAPIEIDVKLACFTENLISTIRLQKLKWFVTQTINVSGGGVLLNVPSELNSDFYAILNLSIDEVDIPRLVLGRVRHCNPCQQNKYKAGIEFVVKENYKEILRKEVIRNLPPALFELSHADRKALDDYIVNENTINN